MNRNFARLSSLFVTTVLSVLAASAAAEDFIENFDDWPTPACYESSSASLCGGSHLEPEEDERDRTTWVDSMPECRSGKCLRLQYRHNEDSHIFRPLGGNWSPHPSQIYISFWFRMDSNHTDGVPARYKLARIIANNSSDPTTLAASSSGVHFSAPETANVRGGNTCTTDFDWSAHLDEWVRIEAWYKDNSPGEANGECQTWITDSSGKQWTSGLENYRFYDGGGFQRIAWIMANVSNFGAWPWSHDKTLFVDDVCIGDSIDDRLTTCTNGTLPPPREALSPPGVPEVLP